MTEHKITLGRREVKKISELFDLLDESGDYGWVKLNQSEDNGIGTVLTATFAVTHKLIEGEFTVVITDEEDW